MKRLPFLYTAMASLLVFANSAYAGDWCPPVAAPEIDGSGTTIALGLAIGLVALIRERRQSK